jgi:hypothetical protein
LQRDCDPRRTDEQRDQAQSGSEKTRCRVVRGCNGVLHRSSGVGSHEVLELGQEILCATTAHPMPTPRTRHTLSAGRASPPNSSALAFYNIGSAYGVFLLVAAIREWP